MGYTLTTAGKVSASFTASTGRLALALRLPPRLNNIRQFSNAREDARQL